MKEKGIHSRIHTSSISFKMDWKELLWLNHSMQIGGAIDYELFKVIIVSSVLNWRKYYMLWPWIYVLVIREQWIFICIKCIKKARSHMYSLCITSTNLNYWFPICFHWLCTSLPSQGCFNISIQLLRWDCHGQCGPKLSNLCVN